MIRVRSIIKQLNYDALVTQGLIPNVYPLIEQANLPTKRYPPFVYNVKEFAVFGLFWDYVLRAGLRLNLTQPVELGNDPITQVIPELPEATMAITVGQLNTYETTRNFNEVVMAALALTSQLYGAQSYTREEIQGYIPTMVNIMKELMVKWQIYGDKLAGSVRFNAEYTHEPFSGHPDVVTDRSVLDIKTTTSFLKMGKESCLQVFAYYALMKATVPNLRYIGFLLPIQRELLLYNLVDWNPAPYLQLLTAEANKIATIPQDPIIVTMAEDGTFIVRLGNENGTHNLMADISVAMLNYRIGGHIAKGKNIATTLREFTNHNPGFPCQMFLGSPRTGRRDAKTAGQVTAAAQVIRETGLRYFTHAPYVINLCANQCDATGDYWQQRFLNEELALTTAMGGLGVVVHVGARKERPEAEALSVMEQMIRTALTYATESCPLLLETPCQEGTEVCGSIQDLGNFFFRFTEQERRKLGLCVDSCHVFAAGFDPLTYLQHWEKYCPVPVKLIHFNDSRDELGSRRDRHASPGTGQIGWDKMRAIGEWCHTRQIPMVME
jgi:deoxyribonuclease-4